MVWIFQTTASTLITALNSVVLLTGGAQAQNIYWQVGSSATLGAGSDFAGSILAQTSITLNNGATVDGRVLALNGSVSFDNNTLTVPEAGTLQLLGLGLASLVTLRRKHMTLN
jgi:hypothetical protein